MHKNLSSIISSKERQQIVVHDVHVSLGHDSKAKTMASDRGKDAFKPKKKKKKNGKEFLTKHQKSLRTMYREVRSKSETGKLRKYRLNFIASLSKSS